MSSGHPNKSRGLGKEGARVSKSTIYNWISTAPSHYRDNIHRHLRYGTYKKRRGGKGTGMSITNRVSIEERPEWANGQELGDWEMDTIVGNDGKGAIGTLVERKSLYMLMGKLDTGKQAELLAHAVVRMLKGVDLPVRTITTDNGIEFAAHEIIARGLNTTVYFAHPYSFWEKGTIENTNGLIRQFIHKKADFRGISCRMISRIVEKINNRPRKKEWI